jgi:GTP cyclohydrolase I
MSLIATQTMNTNLPDHASEQDCRELAIDRVGIRNLRYPINVLDKKNQVQHTVADLGLFVGLPHEFKGTHMSRFIEVLNTVHGELTIRNMPAVLAQIQERLEADNAYLDAEFPYFVEKSAPVSGARSLMEYTCGFGASIEGDTQDFVLKVTVPVKSLCPCSKAISDRGAHNQRSLIRVEVRTSHFVWIEDVIEAVESCASSPLYALLKREDEKFVTEAAYDNPKFAEDLVRDVVIAVRNLEGVFWLKVSADNHESIHNHSAYAEIEWSGDTALTTTPSGPRESQDASAFAFGNWLKTQRGQLNMSQADLATKLDVTASYLCRIESENRVPSTELLERLSHLLSVDLTHLRLRAGVIPADILSRIQADPEHFRRVLSQL